MRVLVIGRQGQVARSLIERAAGVPDLELIAVGRPDVDLELEGSVSAAILAAKPELVINAAAYTAVDLAEDEPERAFRINRDAAGEVAAAAARVGAGIVQLSTDYVFDGRSPRPYRESDEPHPLGVYGQSKWEGEQAVRKANDRHLIIRTSWLYSPFGHNFVKTMLRLVGEREEVRVVDDQVGCPTSALDLADALLAIADMHRQGAAPAWGRTYHLAGGESCSWARFASEIFSTSAVIDGPSARIESISTADWPTRAERPINSILDCARADGELSMRLQPYKQALPPIVARLVVNRRSGDRSHSASTAQPIDEAAKE
ncbi:MAG: dTDP-4-dehydrorhamnose reductase [Sphingomicrobium sp.]